MKKALAALTLAGSLALVGAVPAMATTYPAPGQNEQGQVSNGNVDEGQQFNFSGQGFDANERINVQVQQTGGPQASGVGFSGVGTMAVSAKVDVALATQTFTATADASGRFSIPLTINSAGTYLLTATGVTSGHKVTATVTVKAALVANASSGSALATTGADSGLILWTLVGAGALAAGAASVVVVRRRAKNEVAA